MRASVLRQQRFQQAQVPQAQGWVVAAPVGGLNARDALANMPETDAVTLDNWFCQPTWVELRGGKKTLATFTGSCETLAAYNALSGSNQLFAGVTASSVGSLYRVDNSGGGAGTLVAGGGGPLVQSITGVQYDWVQLGTSAAEVLYLVNGLDNPLLYDGTTWWAITPYVTGTVTGITNAASAVVTINTVSVSNPFTNGTTAGLTGVTGMTQINNVNATITATGGSSGAWTITLNVNSSGFGVYGSGGTLQSPFPYALSTGPSPLTSLSQVMRYKSRLWFVQANTMNVYYLPQNVFAGALTLLPMAANFDLGGSLSLICTNSLDNSLGLSDYIAFVSNQGEVVMFQGFDPAQASTFYETGHFRIGRPLALGRRGWVKIGSDAAVLTTDGLVPLSKALVADRSQPLIAITDKIRSAINGDAKLYGSNWGWQILLYPMGTKIVINVPIQAAVLTYQYVQNTISGAWATFGKLNSPWNALCFELMGDNLYYGTIGSCAQCDTGLSDDGVAFTVTAKPAFSYMNDREHVKWFTQCQPIFQVTGNITLSLTINTDFSTQGATNTVPVSSGNTAPWNTSPWNTTFWGDAVQIAKPWIGLAASGYSASLGLQASVMNLTAKWQSTNFIFKPGTLFYGVPG